MKVEHILAILLVTSTTVFGALLGVFITSQHSSVHPGEYVPTTTYSFSEPTTDSKQITVLIPIEDKDSDAVMTTIKKSGGSAKKHGKVIIADVPQDQVSTIRQTATVLPNREVQAFSIATSEVSAETFWNDNITGKGITVAIIDSGINGHQNNIISQKDFTDTNLNDEYNHGTEVADIILAMAPDVKILNAKVLDNTGKGTEAGVVQAIQYSIDQHADIISISLGGLFDDLNSPLVASVEDAVSKGITVVVASGNCKTGCNGFFGVATPGNAPHVITVGSVSGLDAVSYSSGNNYGGYIKPDLVAPVNGGSLIGTSASTPYVAGASALLKQKYSAQPSQIKSLLEQHAIDLGNPGKDTTFGSGKLNLDFIADELPQPEVIIPITTTQPPSNMQVSAFQAVSYVNNNDTAWTTTFFENWDMRKRAFDAYDDTFIVVVGDKGYTGTGDQGNASSVLIWNGTTWEGNNQTIGFTQEALNVVKIYNKSFFIAGGKSLSGFIPVVLVWNGVNLTRYNLTGTTRVVDIFIESPTDAYALLEDGKMQRYDGTAWSSYTDASTGCGEVATYSIDHWVMQNYTHSWFNKNSLLCGDSNNIKYYNGVSWQLTDLSAVNQACSLRKMQLVAPGIGYAICDKEVWKLNNLVWSTVYGDNNNPAAKKLQDFSFADENFGFIGADNNTMIRWDGAVWSSKNYSGETISKCGGPSTTEFSFEKVILHSRQEGYATGVLSCYLTPVISTVQINSVWVWDGSSWTNESRQSDALQTGIIQSVRRNGVTYALGASSANGLFSGDGSLNSLNRITYPTVWATYTPVLKRKQQLQFLIPSQQIQVNGQVDVNLSNYTVSNKSVSYGIVQQNTSQVSCSITGSDMLHIQGAVGFYGIGNCRISATTSEQTKTSDVLIYAGLVPNVLDVSIEEQDISFDDAGKPSVNVHSVAGSSSYPNIVVKFVELQNGNVVQTATETVTLNTALSTQIVTPSSLSVAKGNTVVVIVDETNIINETTKVNNIARRKYQKNDVYLNVTIENSFAVPITNFLKQELHNYNIVTDPSNAEYIVNVAYNLGNNTVGCNRGTVYADGRQHTVSYAGLAFAKYNGKYQVNVCGARIEGLVAALRGMNKEDLTKNRHIVLGKADATALATYDFMKSQKVTADLVDRALHGGLLVNDNAVRTTDGTVLRMRHYKPLQSQSFLDYLFQIQPNKPFLEPVVMAGGLWSDISAWEEAGKEIASGTEVGVKKDFMDKVEYVPRDVWLIELTGGPGSECDTCRDYTYNDVVDKHWSALVGGVMKLTGKNVISYVGHSNGGRVALDAMKNWTALKGTVVGTMMDGSSIVLPNTANHPIKNYVGVGVPGQLDATLPLLDLVRNKYSIINSQLSAQVIQHPSQADIIVRGIIGLDRASSQKTTRISLNLWKRYNQIINFTSENNPGASINIMKTLIIGGKGVLTNDGVVPLADTNGIFSNIGVVSGSQNKKVLKYVDVLHSEMITWPSIKTNIKEFLNDDPLTGKIENQVNG